MTKRLSAGVLLFAVFVLAFAMTANAERLQPREWVDESDPYRELPLFFRAAAGTTWVQANLGGLCDPAFTADGGDIHAGTDHTDSDVFCFEVPDSLWPAGQLAPYNLPNDRRYHWDHFSRNTPPVPRGSKWHVTQLFSDGVINQSYNAWVGCDITEFTNRDPNREHGNDAGSCDDIAFWVNQTGYGDEWEETLILDVSNLGGGSGGTLTFDLRYDVECVYDYLYLEYLDTAGQWQIMVDAGGTEAVFNGVSGGHLLPTTNDCATGSDPLTDGNYFNDGTLTPAGDPYHGNSVWYDDISFPVPAQTNLQIRWRGSSDPAWSDFDGRGDTDGIAAVDNISLVWNRASPNQDVSDNFEFGDFDHMLVGGALTDSTTTLWQFGSGGNPYDN